MCVVMFFVCAGYAVVLAVYQNIPLVHYALAADRACYYSRGRAGQFAFRNFNVNLLYIEKLVVGLHKMLVRMGIC